MTASTTTLNTREIKPRIGTEILTRREILLSGEHPQTRDERLFA